MLAVFTMLAFVGCKKAAVGGAKTEVAFITDIGTVEDGGCNEQCYNGLKRYCEENGIRKSPAGDAISILQMDTIHKYTWSRLRQR